jgi:hypothetical protein
MQQRVGHRAVVERADEPALAVQLQIARGPAIGVPTSQVKIASSAASWLTSRVTYCGWIIVLDGLLSASESRSLRAVA